MIPVVFIKQALFDVEEVVLWYEEQREGLSYDFELCLEVAINEIQRTPSAFQKRYKDIKIRFTQRFPYGIHYIVKENQIIVIGVFHTSQSPKNWSKRTNQF